MANKELIERSVNALRFLSADGVQQADSGHPGLPMGAAAMAYTIWVRHLKHNPANPSWFDRDRFILSGGHGSMLLYSLLHLTGYPLTLEDLKNFRQWGSLTPGHPEYGHTPGVEVTTGPLGQGFANGVGFAIAEAHLAARFNQPGQEIINHYTYAIVTDGDLMEGVAAEAASLAGHLQLGKMIYLYDDNRISIDGSTDLAFSEDRGNRFEAYGWHVQYVADGNDVEAIDQAVHLAKQDSRPSLIVCRTQIGFGAPNKQGTASAHGEPLGEAELAAAKANLGWLESPRFFIPDEVFAHFRTAVEQGKARQQAWQEKFDAYRQQFPGLGEELHRRMEGCLPDGWEAELPSFPADTKGMASRAASGKVLNALAKRIPEIMGGSADLAPSNKTWLDGELAFQAQTPGGRNFHFGVREHAMGAIVNAMALHGGVMPYGATFLVFSDYMRGALRLSALSHIPSIWVFTHDSIGVGEDGPTHQPVEHLLALRAIPGMTVLRPADANETAEAWKFALRNRQGPTSLILTRQNLPTFDRSTFAPADGLQRGAYVLADLGNTPPAVILMATGSEVWLITAAGQELAAQGIGVRLVSMPAWNVFEQQEPAYRESVLPASIPKRVAVEAGVTLGWERYTGTSGRTIGIDHYGASAPAEILFRKFGFTVENIIRQVKEIL